MAPRPSCTRRSASPRSASPSASRRRSWTRAARWPPPEGPVRGAVVARSSGTQQPGIATPPLDHVALGAFDLAAENPRGVLEAWSAAAEGVMERGEATVTIGLGAGCFAPAVRPLGLRELPPF